MSTRTLHGWADCVFALRLRHCQDEEFPPRDDFSDADQLRVGNDGIFMLAFFSKHESYILGVECILMLSECINLERLLLQWPSSSTGSASACPSVWPTPSQDATAPSVALAFLSSNGFLSSGYVWCWETFWKLLICQPNQELFYIISVYFFSLHPVFWLLHWLL